MGGSELGPWEPLPLAEVVSRFAATDVRWWISGGIALELHVGRSWRDHEDTDVAVVRSEVRSLRTILPGWDVHVAAAGRLSVWDGGDVRADLHQNNLWCRRDPDVPWSLDVTVGDGDSDAWIYRRDPRLRVPWPDAVLTTASGIPYLAPELQLLFKSKSVRAKDDVDAEQVVPVLDRGRRDRLAGLLAPEHPWHRLLAQAG